MKTVSETRSASGFQRLELHDTAHWVDLTVEPGEPELLTIEGPPECVARVKSVVQGDTLKVFLTGTLTDRLTDALTTSLTRRTVTYHLTAKELAEIETAGLIRVHLAAYGDNPPVVKDRLRVPPPQRRPAG